MGIQILEVGVDNISLSWTTPPIEFHNGIIRYYILTLHEVEGNKSSMVNTTVSYHSFFHLHPHYHYNIKISAVTVSAGPQSPLISVKTLETGKNLVQ